MIRFYVLAAVATLAVPILVPYYLTTGSFPELCWVPAVFFCGEILISALILKWLYPSNAFGRCITFGLVFVLVRFVLCYAGSVIDPDADSLRVVEFGQRRNPLVVPLVYMYSVWWVTLTQYAAELLWMPAVLESVLPGMFAPSAARRRESLAPEQTSEPEGVGSHPEPKTFRELEDELIGYPGLVGWMLFSPERLPIWSFGDQATQLENSPEILRRLSDVAAPLLRPEWGRDVCQGLVQTEGGYCILTVLPGDFLFASIWHLGQEPARANAVLVEVIERMERWLNYRFAGVV